MSWFTILSLVVVFVVLAALSGLKPSGTRSIRRTKLMKGARVALVLFLLLAAWFAWSSLRAP